jgi:hypothetical protein
MRKMFRSIGVAAIALATVILGAGCSSTNTQQLVNSTSGDGVLAKIAVPTGQSTSIGASLFVGRFNNSTVLQPTFTSTNGKINVPDLVVAVYGCGKQTVTGSVGSSTNASAGIGDGSRDASIIATGSGNAGGSAGTNWTVKVSGQ